MIVANVVPRPPRTEMVKQMRPKKAQNHAPQEAQEPAQGRATELVRGPATGVVRSDLAPTLRARVGRWSLHCADWIRLTSSLQRTDSALSQSVTGVQPGVSSRLPFLRDAIVQ